MGNLETETVEETSTADPRPAETPKPTETVEFWKSKAREQESRAKANAKAADELAEIKAAQLSAEQRAAQEKADAERERDQARAEALRWRIATKHGISDEDAELFLTATDEETLNRQAERLKEREPEPGKGTHVPNLGNQPPKPPNLDEQIRAAEAAGNSQQAMVLKAQKIADLAQKQK